jgi:putative transposase
VKKTLHAVEVVTPERAAERALPEEVRVSLVEIAGAAKEGLLALAVGTGLAVLHEVMEHEVTELAGPNGEVTLGGRRVAVERPRVRAGDGSGELGLVSYRHFAADDPLSRVVLERMLAGVSARRYARTQEPVGERVEAAARSTSKSAVSRRVVERTREALEELMSRRLDELELAALMIDGLDLDERCNVVALGITRDGTKVALGLWEGSTENATVASALLADLQDRGLDVSGGVLVVIDGAKALAKAVRQVLGAGAVVQRCQRHYADLRVMPTRVEKCLEMPGLAA